MSDSDRRSPMAFWRKEAGVVRRQWRRRQRHRARAALRADQVARAEVDERKTEGWLTW